MIGFINHDTIFEFTDNVGLAKSLAVFGTKVDCDYIVITSKTGVVKGMIDVRGSEFVQTPLLDEGVPYSLQGTYNITNQHSGQQFVEEGVAFKDYEFIYNRYVIPQRIDL